SARPTSMDRPASRTSQTLLVCWMKVATKGNKEMAQRSGWRVPGAAQGLRGGGPSAENGLDKLLGRVGGGRRVLGGRKRGLLKPNGLLITVEVRDAPGALGEVLVKLGPLLAGHVAEQVFVQKLGELATIHTLPRRKCGSSSERSAWRARCRRVLTTPRL